jgi:hypothetical protein
MTPLRRPVRGRIPILPSAATTASAANYTALSVKGRPTALLAPRTPCGGAASPSATC